MRTIGRARTLLALLVAGAGSAGAAPQEESLVESPALCFKARFPAEPEVYRSDFGYKTSGLCRAHHYVVTQGKAPRERTHEVLVLQHFRLGRTPEQALEAILAADTESAAAEVLSRSVQSVADRVELRAHLRTPAAGRSPAQEIRALYTTAHGLVYQLKYTCAANDQGASDRWERFVGGFELLTPVISKDWLPHLSGRGGFSALFPVQPGGEREVAVEVGGQPVSRVEVAAAEEGRWELVASAHPLTELAASGRRRRGDRAAAGALAAARVRALEGLADGALQRDTEVGPGCHELEITGAAGAVPAVRIVRITVVDDALIMAQATGFGADPPRAVLEGFVAEVRPVPRFDGSLLGVSTPDSSLAAATLSTGEHLEGSGDSYGDHAVRKKYMTMPRSEFRTAEAEYLRRPALGAGYSRFWKLHLVREVDLGTAFGRSYFTRDADDVIAIHERVSVDAEGYTASATIIYNRAIDPSHFDRLFRAPR